VTYGAVSGKPMELSGAVMIWKQLSAEGFYEGHPHILPKIAPVLRELVNMIGPGGVRPARLPPSIHRPDQGGSGARDPGPARSS